MLNYQSTEAVNLLCKAADDGDFELVEHLVNNGVGLQKAGTKQEVWCPDESWHHDVPTVASPICYAARARRIKETQHIYMLFCYPHSTPLPKDVISHIFHMILPHYERIIELLLSRKAVFLPNKSTAIIAAINSGSDTILSAILEDVRDQCPLQQG